MSVAISKKDLNVQTMMSDTIFMDPESPAERSVFVDVRDTTDKGVNIGPAIVSRIEARGYRIESDPRRAGYILQVNVLQVGMTNPNAYQASIRNGPMSWGYPRGYTAAAVGAGAAAGALIGYGATGYSRTGALGGALIGAAAVGIIELVANSAVKDVTYSMITDVMVSEWAGDKVYETRQAHLPTSRGSSLTQHAERRSDRLRYATRVGSSANKVNLSFEEARPELEAYLAQSIAGIF
jgi:hypothetical protein